MTVDYIRNPRPERSKPSSIAKANRLGFQLAFIPADNKFPGPGEDRAAVHTESHKVCTSFVAVARCGSPARFAVELLIEHQPIVAIIIKIAMAAVTASRITRSLSAPNNLTAIFFLFLLRRKAFLATANSHTSLDGKLPRIPQPEHRTLCHHINGWKNLQEI